MIPAASWVEIASQEARHIYDPVAERCTLPVGDGKRTRVSRACIEEVFEVVIIVDERVGRVLVKVGADPAQMPVQIVTEGKDLLGEGRADGAEKRLPCFVKGGLNLRC